MHSKILSYQYVSPTLPWRFLFISFGNCSLMYGRGVDSRWPPQTVDKIDLCESRYLWPEVWFQVDIMRLNGEQSNFSNIAGRYMDKILCMYIVS